jgi:adenylate cyclase class IV
LDAHTELELKFEASGVDRDEFLKWAISRDPSSLITVGCPDVYYVQGKSVLRHRWSEGAGELTTKRRRSHNSTTNREEIDVYFDPAKTTTQDVTSLLLATGWKRSLTLLKDHVYVFFYDLPGGGSVSLSLYGVERLNYKTQKLTDLKTFMEIEVEKGGPLDLASSKQILEKWRRELTEKFGLKSPVNRSLYEIYTGKKYRMTKSKAKTK